MNRALLIAPFALAACATVQPSPDGVIRVKLGQTASADGLNVTPLRVLEDSRCPMEARCVWAGRVRISATVNVGSRSEYRELTLNKPETVADGTLELVEVMPPRSTQHPLKAEDYRLGFRFSSGL